MLVKELEDSSPPLPWVLHAYAKQHKAIMHKHASDTRNNGRVV